jgi:hypothetical protein
MSDKTLSLEEQRSRLERRANVIRSRLLRTLDALDSRRHQVTEIGHQAKRFALPVGGALLGAVVLAAGTTMAIRALLENRREQDFAYRLSKSLAPLRQVERPPLWQEAGRKMLLAALGVVATQAAKRGYAYLVEQRAPQLQAPVPPRQLQVHVQEVGTVR